MNISNKILELIGNSFTEGLIGPSMDELNSWIHSHKKNQDTYKALEEFWNIKHSKSKLDKSHVLELIRDKIKNDQTDNNRFGNSFIKIPNKNFIYMVIKVAAVIVISFIFGGLAVHFMNGRLTDNQTIVSTPNGSKTSLTLPDGTKVWLNSGSEIKYPSAFGEKSRQLELTGEAFFDVKKDSKKQFVVKTNDFDVKVYGTKFNVKSYPDEDVTEATLVEGKIVVERLNINSGRVERIDIKPNQKIVFHRDRINAAVAHNNKVKIDISDKKGILKKLEKKPPIIVYKGVDTKYHTSWKENKLVFKNTTFEQMATRIERWYDVKLHFESGKIKDFRYNGTFDNETIEEAFNALRLTTPFQYKIVNRDIYITMK